MIILSTDRINEQTKQGAERFVRATDDAYTAQLHAIAEHIRNTYRTRPIVLISGPSGSGKTTTAHMLEQILDGWGLESHTLSMDNYFKTLSPEERAAADRGELDLESPERVDAALLHEQLAAMVRGEPVSLPVYDFVNSRRTDSGRVLTRGEREIVILEGIHTLNPDVVRLPDENMTKLYISVRTRVVFEDVTLHPSKIRLLRRMLRDRVGRGRKPEETLSLFASVQRGESRFIMPYKHRADFDIDTFIAYELGVYRRAMAEELAHLHHEPELDALLTVLDHVEEIPAETVPRESLIREFIGGGQFEH
ncbi:MAG: nucleoside kinase [Clostridia bacterium]|nr:nucleoside kinase [Clostridia bacterium]